MSGPTQDPKSKVAYLKHLSADELVTFVDGVLEENGAGGEASRDAGAEGENPVGPRGNRRLPRTPARSGSGRESSARGWATPLVLPAKAEGGPGNHQQ